MDKTTIGRIAKLHPKLRSEVSDIIVALNNRGVQIRIVQGYRTFEEQDKLFNQKPKVTNAKGGQSYHNYGLAVDFCLLHKDGTISWDLKEDLDEDKTADWLEVVEEFEKKGWSWGGYWKFKDNPHFEKTFGYNFRQLLELKNLGKIDKEGYVLI